MCTETANAQESIVAAIKNLATTSLRGGLGERPPPNPNVASLTMRYESRAQKDSFSLLPCSSDSCSMHKIGSCRNQKIGDDKFERRPWRAAPPNPDVTSLTTRWESRTQKDSFFFLPYSLYIEDALTFVFVGFRGIFSSLCGCRAFTSGHLPSRTCAAGEKLRLTSALCTEV
jgi:hypothetical protein